jgi:hypothetical protein
MEWIKIGGGHPWRIFPMSNVASSKLAIGAAVLLLGGAAIYFNWQSSHAELARDQLAAQVTQLKAANVAEAMPELPVMVSFHHALLGHSMVADFHSHAPTDMAVVVDVMDAATRGHRQFEIGVGPGSGGVHMGPLERMRFEPGDVLTLTHDGYKPVVAEVGAR